MQAVFHVGRQKRRWRQAQQAMTEVTGSKQPRVGRNTRKERCDAMQWGQTEILPSTHTPGLLQVQVHLRGPSIGCSNCACISWPPFANIFTSPSPPRPLLPPATDYGLPPQQTLAQIDCAASNPLAVSRGDPFDVDSFDGSNA